MVLSMNPQLSLCQVFPVVPILYCSHVWSGPRCGTSHQAIIKSDTWSGAGDVNFLPAFKDVIHNSNRQQGNIRTRIFTLSALATLVFKMSSSRCLSLLISVSVGKSDASKESHRVQRQMSRKSAPS